MVAKVVIVGEDDGNSAKGGGSKNCQCKHNEGNLGCACTEREWFAPGKVPKKFICGQCSSGKHKMYGPKH